MGCEVHSLLLTGQGTLQNNRWILRINLESFCSKKGKEVVGLSKREEYEARSEELLTPIMEENHFELVDVEYVKEAGNWYLRAYVDKEGGITLDDCELVNRAWSDIMDKEDFIPDAYVLEVSSPGLGRQLKKEKDFKRIRMAI